MAKRKRADNQFISMRYRVDFLPRRISKRRVLQTMLEIVNFERDRLPRSWAITWLWRNDLNDEEHEGPIRQVTSAELSQNRGDGFLKLMSRRIEADLALLSPVKKVKR